LKGYVGIERGTHNGASNCTVGLHYMKITVRLPNGTSTSCTTDNDCGPGYYCTSSKCAKCHDSCDWCTGGNATDCIKCSRFSKQWQSDSNNLPTICDLSYFNANVFTGGYTFSNIPPIKTGRATVGLWLYINQPSSGTRYMHIVVQDNIVLTIETTNGTNDINAYCSIGQMYHSFLTTPALENATTNGTFTTAKTALTSNKMIVSTTANSVQYKWYYYRCAVNTQNKEFYVMRNYNKGTPYSTQDNGYTMNSGWQDELIFNGQSIQTDMKFYKYYRSNDTISVYINNLSAFNSAGMNVYIRNLFVFNDYIPKGIDKLQYL
jgi:hypothetical protein